MVFSAISRGLAKNTSSAAEAWRADYTAGRPSAKAARAQDRLRMTLSPRDEPDIADGEPADRIEFLESPVVPDAESLHPMPAGGEHIEELIPHHRDIDGGCGGRARAAIGVQECQVALLADTESGERVAAGVCRIGEPRAACRGRPARGGLLRGNRGVEQREGPVRVDAVR